MLSLTQALVLEIYYVTILMPVADNHPLFNGDVGLHWSLPLMSLRCHGRLHGIRCSRDLIQNSAISIHRRSQGVQWVHLHPQGGEKNFFRPNLQEKCVSAPHRTLSAPQPEQESIFRSFCWVVKSAPPQTKSWLCLC